MSETIDYAEMLEIPVSTLNVTQKRGKKRRAALAARHGSRGEGHTAWDGRYASRRWR